MPPAKPPDSPLLACRGGHATETGAVANGVRRLANGLLGALALAIGNENLQLV